MDSTQSLTAPAFETESLPYLGRWHRLVSTTNWEKGRIIAEWRSALAATDAPTVEYSDEAWARRVNNVSGQHVGRLRRVYERFGAVYDEYTGLFWSHFQAALDWNDAEMWLEGAVQSEWAVAEMRRQRWEALGTPADQRPRDEELVAGELDEDAADEPNNGDETPAYGSLERVQPVGDHDAANDELTTAEDDRHPPDGDDSISHVEAAPPVQPFAQLPSLPSDLSDAFESFKLAILRQRLTNWHDVARADVLDSLEALKQFALAPLESNGAGQV